MKNYADLLDKKIFYNIRSPCSARAITSMMINELVKIHKTPSNVTKEELATINESIAYESGF
jgi:hypothetical protein